MKKTLLILAVALGSFTLLTSELDNFDGSEGGKTGSPGDNGVTCTQCHGGSATQQEGWLSSNIPAAGYIPGVTYMITASGTHSGVSRFGFETTAEDSNNDKTGTFEITDPTQTRFANDNSAVTHKSAGVIPDGDSKSWSFDWIAPEAGTGDVTLYAAFNAANGNGGTSGDVIYKTSMDLNEDVSISVASNFDDEATAKVFPNPFTTNFQVNISGSRTSVSKLEVFNFIGKLIYSQDSFVNSDNILVSANELNTGIYYVVVYFDDNTRITKRIVKK